MTHEQNLHGDPLPGVTLGDLAAIVAHHRWKILRGCLIATMAVAAFLLVQPREYESRSMFMASASRAKTGISVVAAQFGVTIPGGDAALSPQFFGDLLTSDVTLNRVVSTQLTWVERGGERNGTVADFLRISASDSALRRESSAAKLRSMISVEVRSRTGVVVVTTRARSARVAQTLNQQLIKTLNEYNVLTRAAQSTLERKFIEGRLAEVRASLSQAEDSLRTFLERNREYNTSSSARFHVDRLQRNVGTQQQLYTSIGQAFEQARFDEVRDTPVITEIEPAQLAVRPTSRSLVKYTLTTFVLAAVVLTALIVAWSRVFSLSDTHPTIAYPAATLRAAIRAELKSPGRALAALFGREQP